MLSALMGGCDEDAALRTFRGAASDGLASGLKSIFTGFVDGVFAVVDEGVDTANDGSAADTETEATDG